MPKRSRSLNRTSLCLYLRRNFWTVDGKPIGVSLCRHCAEQAEFRGVSIAFTRSFIHVLLIFEPHKHEGRKGRQARREGWRKASRGKGGDGWVRGGE